jgi:hypothetical protein
MRAWQCRAFSWCCALAHRAIPCQHATVANATLLYTKRSVHGSVAVQSIAHLYDRLPVLRRQHVHRRLPLRQDRLAGREVTLRLPNAAGRARWRQLESPPCTLDPAVLISEHPDAALLHEERVLASPHSHAVHLMCRVLDRRLISPELWRCGLVARGIWCGVPLHWRCARWLEEPV